MAHISVPENIPGIVSLFLYRKDTGALMNKLSETLMRGPSKLTRAERELIAAFVSNLNDCKFCTMAHSAFAAAYLNGENIAEDVMADFTSAPISTKLKALMKIAQKVRNDGKSVTDEDVRDARQAGADDSEIHDTVLISALFSMYNRYVDGLKSWAPDDPALYASIAQIVTRDGYTASPKLD